MFGITFGVARRSVDRARAKCLPSSERSLCAHVFGRSRVGRWGGTHEIGLTIAARAQVPEACQRKNHLVVKNTQFEFEANLLLICSEITVRTLPGDPRPFDAKRSGVSHFLMVSYGDAKQIRACDLRICFFP